MTDRGRLAKTDRHVNYYFQICSNTRDQTFELITLGIVLINLLYDFISCDFF